jgi:hypothetical protein
MIILILIIAIGIFWRLGGWDKAGWTGYRDVLVPVILGVWYGVVLVWWMGLIVFALANLIRMGYGAYDPEHDDEPSNLAMLTKDREGSLIRAIYGFITAFAIGIGPAVFTGCWIKFAFYVTFNVILEYALNRMRVKDYVQEFLIGSGV